MQLNFYRYANNNPEKLLSKNRASRKRSLSQRHLKTSALHFTVWTENILKRELCENDDVTIIV